MKSRNRRLAYTSEEVLGVLTIVGILFALLIPAFLTVLSIKKTTENARKAATELCMQWEKVDDPSFTLEFTKGGHLTIIDNGSELYTKYSIEEKGTVHIYVENILRVSDNPNYEFSSHRSIQAFTTEILSSGELLMANSRGSYTNAAIVAKMVGRYRPLGIDVTQASSRIETRLVDIRGKNESTVSQLATLKQDRSKLVNRLRSAGVRSPIDLQRVPSAKPLVNELTELVQQISSAEKRHTNYIAIIDQLESAQRRFKRREDLVETELPGKDAEEINTILAEVDEKLTKLLDDELIHDLNVEAVLEQELRRKTN